MQELQLGYRTSIFERCSWCILEAEFTLHPGDAQEIHTAMQEYMRRRKEKQPLEYPSAGSTFKRPVGQFAGKLIEDCGLRGFRVGGAAISEKHCGFVVNLGNATCADVVSLTEQVRQIVLEKIRLHPGTRDPRGGITMPHLDACQARNGIPSR
mgnify:CR=1 FL=1